MIPIQNVSALLAAVRDPSGSEPQPIYSDSVTTRLRPAWQPTPTVFDFPMDVPGMWHGQCGQDALVSALLSGRRDGYFVDLAAHHPVFISNTRALERDYDWRGLCIEANPRYSMLLLASRRKCHVVPVAVAERLQRAATFIDPMRGGFGALERTMEAAARRQGGRVQNRLHVPTLPFGMLLDEVEAPKHLDYLSLDVERAETLVMASFPFSRYTISILTIESPEATLRHRLKAHGYLRICRLGYDEVWAHKRTVLNATVASRVVRCAGVPRCEPMIHRGAAPWRCEDCKHKCGDVAPWRRRRV